MKIRKNKNPKALLCGDNANKSAHSSLCWSLQASWIFSFPISISFFFICYFDLCVMRFDYCIVFFIIGRNSLVKTLWIDWNLRFILKPRWFHKTFKLSPKIPWVRTVGSSLIQWINIMTKNPKKHLSFGQNKHKQEFERIKIFRFITSNSLNIKYKS